MHLAFVEIANFRKLKRVRIDLHKQKTLFVGANNSGKTSALLALRYFLYRRGGFNFGINDFTLCHRERIRNIGKAWISNAAKETPDAPKLSDWIEILPFLDVWLDAKDSDLHYVSHILPMLDWSGGKLGVRLRLEPKDLEALYRDFIETTKSAGEAQANAKDKDGRPVTVTLWPVDLLDFLGRRLSSHFGISSFILDPSKVQTPVKGIATPQELSPDAEPLDGVDPFEGLLQINYIPAQRGFADGESGDANSGEASSGKSKEARKLAKQFSDYFTKHLDPNEKPNATDILALKAIEDAQKAYDERLEISFSGPLKEMQSLGYPGVTDPRVQISTRLKPVDGLNHAAAVQYEVAAMAGTVAARLPEDYNGLGYQNLISMVFRLMSFRDDWMRVGKAKGKKDDNDNSEPGLIPPIHLVLIEEPEVHLHVQVQQVFIRNAYNVLRKNEFLGDNDQFTTQLIASTHSSHVAHEVEFSCIRYFRRYPANYPGKNGPLSTVPISTVVNLTEAFGDANETTRFATRYLRATHADLFFADAAIFIEGTAERILLPHFMKKEFPYLAECYITWLEVGGSHAHRLRPLIEHLGILALIIADIDACDPAKNRKAVRPIRGQNFETRNATLRDWWPKQSGLDVLLGLKARDKSIEDGPLSAIRVTYQTEVKVERDGKATQVCPYTFEDAIALENISLMGSLTGGGLIGSFAKIINAPTDASALAQSMFEALDTSKKAEFALDLLELKTEPGDLRCPSYICEGFEWLQKRLKVSKEDVLETATTQAEKKGDVAQPSPAHIQAAALGALQAATDQISASNKDAGSEK
jgi:predicted ATP-dependent endonuclease of OLD family